MIDVPSDAEFHRSPGLILGDRIRSAFVKRHRDVRAEPRLNVGRTLGGE